MKDDVLAGLTLLFGLIFILFSAVLYEHWKETRDILGNGILARAQVIGSEIRTVSESLGPPYYTVVKVRHLFVRLEFPGPGGAATEVWHDFGSAVNAQAADSYELRYPPRDPERYRIVGLPSGSHLAGGIVLGLFGLVAIGVVIWRLTTGMP